MTKLFDDYGRPIIAGLTRSCLHRLAGGNLATDGIQWSTEVPTVAADEDKEVLSVTLDNGQVGEIAALLLALTLAIKAGSATADVKYKWQARNKGGTWVDLHSYVTIENVNTTYVERTMSGYRIEGVEAIEGGTRLLIHDDPGFELTDHGMRMLFFPSYEIPGDASVEIRVPKFVSRP